MMNGLGIARSILSLASPHSYFGDPIEAVELTRELNEYGAAIVGRYPKHFGLFATLPLPLIDQSLTEIEYAFDRLKVIGIKLPTNAGGFYLTDARFEPIFDALDRRHSIVVLYPVRPSVDAIVPRGVLSTVL